MVVVVEGRRCCGGNSTSDMALPYYGRHEGCELLEKASVALRNSAAAVYLDDVGV